MRILIAGDYCPRNRVAQKFEEEGYASVLSNVKRWTELADYSIVNMECPVMSKNVPPIEKIGPSLRCSESGVKGLLYSGFQCVTLANNHFRDYGNEGVAETIKVLEDNSIDHVGGGGNIKEASKVLYKDVKGQKLAIINCCEHEFSIATETAAGSNPLDPIHQYYAIREARKNADVVIVIVHGGHEHFQLPSTRMVETYRFFIDAGADAVVNHHQHCYSGYENYSGKPIFYGLGNFCFDHPQKHSGIWTEGYMVAIDFSTAIPSFEIIPYHQCADNPSVEILPVGTFDNKLTELNDIITNPKKLQIAEQKYYSKSSKSYGNIFEPMRNRFYLGAKRRGWLPSFISKERKLTSEDYIMCEAHRDKLIYWLKNN